jgi:cytochrome c oxidase assembly protein subunit 17
MVVSHDQAHDREFHQNQSERWFCRKSEHGERRCCGADVRFIPACLLRMWPFDQLFGSKPSKEGEKTPGDKAEGKPKKICCACPDTKRERDDCILEHGEDACAKYIELHKECLRSEGFDVGKYETIVLVNAISPNVDWNMLQV